MAREKKEENKASLLFFFQQHQVAFGVLVPWPGIQPVPPAVEM